jgi:hypothetical protein
LIIPEARSLQLSINTLIPIKTQAMKTNKLQNLPPFNPTPTRQQLQAFLQSKGMSPEQLKLMSSWDQVRLTREYQQSAG